jgi:hypothetical protein
MNTPGPNFFSEPIGDEVQAPGQAELFAHIHDREEVQATREKAGVFTAERFASQRPADYAQAVALLKDGETARSIARRLGVSQNTVRAVRFRERLTVDALRGKSLENLVEFIAAGTERMIEEVDMMDRDRLPVAVAVAVDKVQLLTGGATARVAIVDESPDQDWQAYIAGLPSVMGLGAEESAQRESAGEQLTATETGALECPVDMQSPVFADATEEEADYATDNATEPAPQDAQADGGPTTPARSDLTAPGGAGVRATPPPPETPIHSPKRGSDTKAPSPGAHTL